MAVGRGHEELTVITKTYDLILWSCHHTGKFPRNHRFVLGERIERNLYDLLEILIRAKYTRNRQELAKRKGLDVEAMKVPGDHMSCVPSSMKQAIQFFQSK